MCQRNTSTHWSLGMPDSPRAASTSLLQDQKVILSVDEKLLMKVCSAEKIVLLDEVQVSP